MDDAFDDDTFRSLATDHADRRLLSDADVDAAWNRLVRTVRVDRRRRRTQLALVAAAIVLVLSTVGRTTAISGGQALVRFLTGGATSTIEGAADAVIDQVGRATSSSPNRAHGTIDLDPAHDQLNAAVGWERWRPGELAGAADRLRAAAALDPTLGPRAVEAADLIDRATDDGNRDAAVRAHRVVSTIEVELYVRQATPATTTTTA
jgi:hypothetical protein